MHKLLRDVSISLVLPPVNYVSDDHCLRGQYKPALMIAVCSDLSSFLFSFI